MTHRYRLHYAPDNASLVIRMALEEMGQPYETCLVDRRAGAQHTAAYRRLNPNGLIPVLETPQGPMFETAAILLWLCDQHQMLAPMPAAPDRAAFLKWLFFASNTLHADLRISFYPDQYIGTDLADQAVLRRHVQSRLAMHLGQLNTLAGQSPSWLGGEQVSVLDYYLAAMLRWMALYPAKSDRSWYRLDTYPHLYDIMDRLEQRDATRAAQIAEGLGPTPFTKPRPAQPPEGSAT